METNTILYCIRPIVFFNRLFGVLPCEVVQERGNLRIISERKHLFYSIIFTVFLTGFFHWAVVELIEMHSWRNLGLIAAVAAFGQIYAQFFVALIDMITGWLYRFKSLALINKINIVDQRLLELEMGFNYPGDRRTLLYQLLGLAIVPVGASMVNCFVINQRVMISFLCYYFICFLPIVVITLKEFQYYNSVLLIRKKLRLINANILTIGNSTKATGGQEEVNVEVRNSNQVMSIPMVVKSAVKIPTPVENYTKKLKTLAKIHSELIEILKEIQVIYGPHLFSSILTSFGVITIQMYYMFAGVVNDAGYNVIMFVMTTIWVMIQFLLIMVNVIVCSFTSDTVRITDINL